MRGRDAGGQRRVKDCDTFSLVAGDARTACGDSCSTMLLFRVGEVLDVAAGRPRPRGNYVT